MMLIEVLVAVSVIVVVLVAASKLGTQSLKTSRMDVSRQIATRLANSCLEVAKQDRDQNQAAFFATGHTFVTSCPCLANGLNNLSCSLEYTDMGIVGDSKQIQAKAKVTWSDGGQMYTEFASITFTQVSLL